jgi:hypothetical protein
MTPRQRPRSGANRIVLVLMNLIVALGLLEVVLRAVDPIGIAYFFEAKRYFAAMQDNDIYAYIHRPGYQETFQGVRVSINSHGLRGREFKTVKSPGKIRILILGDSVVFGWGAPQDSIFGVRLQDMFNSWTEEVEVIPAGVGSWNTRTEYEFLRSTAIQFQPDILLLVIVANDLDPHRRGRTEVDKAILFKRDEQYGLPGVSPGSHLAKAWQRVVSYSYACQYAQYYMKVKKVHIEQAQVSLDSPQWQDARLALEGIATLCLNQSIELIPYLYGTSDTIKTDPVLSLYREHLESIGVQALPLLDEKLKGRRYQNSLVDGHQNADGHAMIADVIYKRLAPVVKRRLEGTDPTFLQ